MKILIYLGIIFIVGCVLTYFRYRIPYSEKIRSESVVIYKMIDIGNTDFYRYSFESIFGNKRIYLTNDLENMEYIYCSKKDFYKLWPESPFNMKEKKYTVKFKFEIQKLIFGGSSIAKILSVENISKAPSISKS